MKTFAVKVQAMLLLLIMVIIASVAFGSVRIPILETLNLIITKIPFINKLADFSAVDDANLFIVYNLRLPRILSAGFVGASLALSGACFQSIFQNPMAEPYIMGVSSGAAFGAAIGILLGLGNFFLGFGAVSLCAFLGAVAVSIIVFGLGRVRGRINSVSILLSGVIISSVLSAVISLIMMINRDKLEQIVFWTMGSFNGASFEKIKWTVIPFFICFIWLLSFSKELNALSVGDKEALSFGVRVEYVKKAVLLISSFLAALSVAISGIIGFVGLIVPHIFRIFAGNNHKKLLPISAIGGAIFLILCDTAARSLLENQEIPVGIFTAFLGGPFFLYLLRKSKRGE